MKKRIITAAAVIVLLAVGTGFGILAAGTLGSADDPLITLSYLNEKFKTELVAELNAKISEHSAAINTKVDEKLAGIGEADEPVPADAFLIVTMTAGQTLVCEAGAEFMPRSGIAVVTGAAVLNTTAGTAAEIGSEALINNMYIADTAGGGVAVASDTASVLVRGNYTIVSPAAP